MFNIRRNNKADDEGKAHFKAELAGFADRNFDFKREFMNELSENNNFIEKEARMREMVESMLSKEFSDDIKNIKSYNLLVDAVINKLKKDELGDCEDISFND